MSALLIRPLAPADDLAQITRLIHAAYAPHAQRGLRYWGTHQSVEDTAERFASGTGLLALRGDDYVGTITVRPPNAESEVALYRDAHTWTFGQFAVDPAHKGSGIGRALHNAATAHARARGARRMALDTAEPAAALIAMYETWGYRIAGACDWRPHTNYPSVVMALDLT